jgi:hypothetical protein
MAPRQGRTNQGAWSGEKKWHGRSSQSAHSGQGTKRRPGSAGHGMSPRMIVAREGAQAGQFKARRLGRIGQRMASSQNREN